VCVPIFYCPCSQQTATGEETQGFLRINIRRRICFEKKMGTDRKAHWQAKILNPPMNSFKKGETDMAWDKTKEALQK